MTRLYNDKHLSLPVFLRTPKVILRQMHARAATSDAYDAPVNYRRASGNARDGEHIKSLIYYPVTETFCPNAILCTLCITAGHVVTMSQKKKKMRIFRNYHSFSGARSLK